jgi:tRNA pseudouridine55 synthase
MKPNNKTGILVVDKESGPTSHDVVARVRRIIGERRVGHCGTLDPLATGVLVTCIGRFTRLNEWLSAGEKEYIAELTLGAVSNTFDAQGTIEAIEGADAPSLDLVAESLGRFQGAIMQRPPAYSAVKVDGERSYTLARQNRAVELAARPVTVSELAVSSYEYPKLMLRLVCSRGTYVRSIAHDLGNLLGCGAYVSKLKRTRVGSLDMTMARSLDEIDEATAMGELEACFVAPHLALSGLDHVALQHPQLDSFAHGNAVRFVCSGRGTAKVCAVFDEKRDLFGIGEWRGEGRLLQPLRVLREPVYAN